MGINYYLYLLLMCSLYRNRAVWAKSFHVHLRPNEGLYFRTIAPSRMRGDSMPLPPFGESRTDRHCSEYQRVFSQQQVETCLANCIGCRPPTAPTSGGSIWSHASARPNESSKLVSQFVESDSRITIRVRSSYPTDSSH